MRVIPSPSRMIKKPMGRYNKSEEMLQRAMLTIPLGAQTFSKSLTQFPRGISPFFAERGEGAWLYDVDGNRYADFLNGLASITLGYNDPDVNNAVREQLDRGSIFSLSSCLEFEVAERIVEMVPCAEMVRFGKNGSDATSGAVRLARAYTGKDYIFICGYHGWHDWYIGATTKDLGVPKATKELTKRFDYNDISSLQKLFDEYKENVAGVILEPISFDEPKDNFLEQVKELTHQNNAVLIFDEVVSGFRFSNGGAQEYFGVTPDLATFGKGLANGYPLSAVAGNSEIMKLMETVFFSFTFGGETLSLAAARAVLDKLKSQPVIHKMQGTGQTILDDVNTMITEYKFEELIRIKGLPVWTLIGINEFHGHDAFTWKTLLLQEMFANGVLTIGTHNISFSHAEEHIEQLKYGYRSFFEKVQNIMQGANMKEMLHADPLVPLFKVR